MNIPVIPTPKEVGLPDRPAGVAPLRSGHPEIKPDVSGGELDGLVEANHDSWGRWPGSEIASFSSVARVLLASAS